MDRQNRNNMYRMANRNTPEIGKFIKSNKHCKNFTFPEDLRINKNPIKDKDI